MFIINISQNDFQELVQDMAFMLGLQSDGQGMVELSDPVGSGYFRAFRIMDGLQIILINAVLNEKFMVCFEQSDENSFTLQFEDQYIGNSVTYTGSKPVYSHADFRHVYAGLSSNHFFNAVEVPAGRPIRAVRILLHETWMKKHMGMDEQTGMVCRYISMKSGDFEIDKLDVEFGRILDELWAISPDDPMMDMVIQNRISMLIERFFMQMKMKLMRLKDRQKLSGAEIRRITEVEALLVGNFNEPPPSIGHLAKIASMSPTKLKTSFRQIYGDSIYAYYQKVRLQKAYQLLKEGKYNVKETADEVGFSSTSSFIAAFRKQFAFSPGILAVEKGMGRLKSKSEAV